MGFKKTSEGRVFFKSPDNDDTPNTIVAPEVKTAEKPIKSTAKKPTIKQDNMQMQILLLLKSLNSKLKDTKEDQTSIKKELDEYKETIKSLEEKTEKQQSDYIDLEQKVASKQNEVSKKSTRVENSVKTTLKQLEEAKSLVKQLEEKSEDYDKTLEKIKNDVKTQTQKQNKNVEKLKETIDKKNQIIEKKQKALEDTQKIQGEKMVNSVATYVALTKRVSDAETRQEALDNKIEDATSEYLKLDRKIDKVIEDRNRILRKVERIEQAVLETRDALNAKAMVLLTDQGIAGVSMPKISDQTLQTDPMILQRRLQEEAMMPWWRKPIRLQATSLALLILAVLLLGWVLSAANRPDPVITTREPIVQPPPKVILNTPKSEDKQTLNIPLKEEEESNIKIAHSIDSKPNFQLEHDYNNKVPAQNSIKAIQENNKHDNQDIIRSKDLDISNDKQMLAAMEENPEMVAERLNQIEPQNIAAPYNKHYNKHKKQENKDINAKQIASDATSPAQIIDNAYITELKKRIKPDPNLSNIAKKIEEKAFEGVPEAQHDMGAIYVSGNGKVKQDLKRAVLWFQEAANNGVANAKYNLGVLYHQGMGVEKNLDKALKLYTQAAKLGHPEAQYNLGIANIEGIGVPYNPQKAASYFKAAAKHGIIEAAYNLGLIYENGLLGKSQPDIALTWYKHAANGGSPEAKSAMQQLAISLGISQEDIDRIVKNVEKNNSSLSNIKDQKQLISKTQNELMRRGLYPGPVDGVMGPMTENAIKSFQKAANIDVTGEVSEDLLKYLRASSSYP